MDQIDTGKCIDPEVTGKVEELSTYIDRVEEQIKKIRAEAAAREENKPAAINQKVKMERIGTDSALAVADLMGPQPRPASTIGYTINDHHEPPLTERIMQPMSTWNAQEQDSEHARLQTMATPKNEARSFEEQEVAIHR